MATMNNTTATVYPTDQHSKIVISLYRLGAETWPAAAVTQSGILSLDWLCEFWPCEPGNYWQRDSERRAIVRQLNA